MTHHWLHGIIVDADDVVWLALLILQAWFAIVWEFRADLRWALGRLLRRSPPSKKI